MKRFIANGLLIFSISLFSSAAVNAQSSAVSKEFFGLHIHRADQGTSWPDIPFGSWRLWDAYVTWADLEPAPGKWNFSRLDRDVALSEKHNVQILLPLANTPGWASARPTEASAYKPGNASEPANLEDWRRYVRKVGERYKGRIRHYEIWNEPNLSGHYTGSINKIVELACDAYEILKSIDPQIQVVSPAVSTGGKDHVQYLDRFLASGGKKCIDVVAYHFYVTRSGPEAMVPIIRDVRKVMTKNDINEKPLWNTETGWRFGNDNGAPDHEMVRTYKKISSDDKDFMLKAFVLSKAEGVERFYWYSWDNPYGLGLVDPKSGKPKQVVPQWRDAFDRLLGASQVRCPQNRNSWSCSFIRKDGTKDEISWSTE
jgi:hypothetical protein